MQCRKMRSPHFASDTLENSSVFITYKDLFESKFNKDSKGCIKSLLIKIVWYCHWEILLIPLFNILHVTALKFKAGQ